MKFLSDKEFFSLFKGEKVLDVHRCSGHKDEFVCLLQRTYHPTSYPVCIIKLAAFGSRESCLGTRQGRIG